MMRLLYISGMIFFAVLMGDCADRLRKEYRAGTLFDEFNSVRRSAVSLLAISSTGLGALGILEAVRIRRRAERGTSASFGMPREKRQDSQLPAASDIYTAPSTVDAWPHRVPRISGRPARRSLRAMLTRSRIGFWMSILRISSAVLPTVYVFILLYYLIFWVAAGIGIWWLSILFPMLLLGAIVTAAGILRRKSWGRRAGFVMAVFHLLIFPIGTFAGLIMMIALIGATSEFDAISRRRGSRRARRRRTVTA